MGEKEEHAEVMRGAGCRTQPLLGFASQGEVGLREPGIQKTGPRGLVLSRRERPSSQGHPALQLTGWPGPSCPSYNPCPHLLLQASSTCPKCHTYPCWCLQHQAHPPPPWTASPTSPQHPSTSAAGSAAPRSPRVTPLPPSWVWDPGVRGRWPGVLCPPQRTSPGPP